MEEWEKEAEETEELLKPQRKKRPCPVCKGGTRRVAKGLCSNCLGTGVDYQYDKRNLKARIQRQTEFKEQKAKERKERRKMIEMGFGRYLYQKIQARNRKRRRMMHRRKQNVK